MLTTTLLAAATALLPALTSAAPLVLGIANPYNYDDACIPNGVRVISARGSGTLQGTLTEVDFIGDYVAQTIGQGSQAHDLVYPATWDFGSSEPLGVQNLTSRIIYHSQTCPDTKFVLIGYSQGASVVGDTLIGYSGTRGQGLPQQYHDNIAAIVMFGDPDFVPGQPWNAGTSWSPGRAQRDNYDQYTSYGFAGKMRSYCDEGDTYCATGSYTTGGIIHTSYFSPGHYVDDAQDFIISTLKAQNIG